MHTSHTVVLPTGVNMAYVEAGKGSHTLLFIHGLACYSQSWQKNMDSLQHQFRCIAIDLPGNGYSGYADYPYSISFFASCVKDFIQHLGLQQVTLVGHSLGGQIAIRLAADNPEMIKGLVLCAPAGFETFSELEKSFYHSSFHFFNFFSSDANSLSKSVISSFYHYTDQADDLIENLQRILQRYPPNAFRSMVEKCINGMLQEPVFHLLSQIACPTLVFFGERDVFIPNRLIHPTTTKQIAEMGIQQIPQSQLVLFPRCGHFVQWENYREVNSHIQNFVLNQLQRPQSGVLSI